MKYYLAVFTSRHATLSFSNELRAQGVPVAVVNTPSSISSVCGISAKFLPDFRVFASKIASKYSNFAGFYLYDSMNGIVKRI